MSQAVLTLLGILITATVTLLTQDRLGPRLRRRIKGHAALVKDLPPDVARPLIELLRLEVRDLARRDAVSYLVPNIGPLRLAIKALRILNDLGMLLSAATVGLFITATVTGSSDLLIWASVLVSVNLLLTVIWRLLLRAVERRQEAIDGKRAEAERNARRLAEALRQADVASTQGVATVDDPGRHSAPHPDRG